MTLQHKSNALVSVGTLFQKELVLCPIRSQVLKVMAVTDKEK